MLTIRQIVLDRRPSHEPDAVPQPAGREIADAYHVGSIQGDEQTLYVLAVLLTKARAERTEETARLTPAPAGWDHV